MGFGLGDGQGHGGFIGSSCIIIIIILLSLLFCGSYNMDRTNNYELKYTKCNFCGQEKNCFVQYEFNKEQTKCSDCLRSDYID